MTLIKKLTTVSAAALIAFSVMGCGGNKKPVVVDNGYESAVPSQITTLQNTKFKHSLTATGEASAKSKTIAIKKAKMVASKEVSKIFEQKVASLEKMYTESINDEDLEHYQETITVFTNLKVSGVTIEATLVEPENGRYNAVVLAVLSADKLKEIFEQKAAASSAKNLMTEFKANKAYNELEAMVAKDDAARAQY